MNKTTNQKLIHPIFESAKNKTTLKQEQILTILKMHTNGFSYNQIARRLFAENKIDLTPQRIGIIIKKYRNEWRAQA